MLTALQDRNWCWNSGPLNRSNWIRYLQRLSFYLLFYWPFGFRGPQIGSTGAHRNRRLVYRSEEARHIWHERDAFSSPATTHPTWAPRTLWSGEKWSQDSGVLRHNGKNGDKYTPSGSQSRLSPAGIWGSQLVVLFGELTAVRPLAWLFRAGNCFSRFLWSSTSPSWRLAEDEPGEKFEDFYILLYITFLPVGT